MKIGWQTSAGGNDRIYLPGQLTVPARYNFMQGYIYRLKITDIPGREGVQLYPTIEVAPATPPTDAYLTHNPIPVQFTPEDFDQVIDGGNFVTKVIYLPDPKYQELAVAGVETLVSTRLEPGVDPILEADKRGTILLIVRLGAIDLEMPDTGTAGAVLAPGTVMAPSGVPGAVMAPSGVPGAMMAPPGVPGAMMAPPGVPGAVGPPPTVPGAGGVMLAPGALPPGRMRTAPIPSVPLETAAPVTPAAPAGAPVGMPPTPAPTTPPPPPAEPPPAEPPPPAAAPPAGAPPAAAVLPLESPGPVR
jgi:hypothetical protein